jgi:hypothetical protein
MADKPTIVEATPEIEEEALGDYESIYDGHSWKYPREPRISVTAGPHGLNLYLTDGHVAADSLEGRVKQVVLDSKHPREYEQGIDVVEAATSILGELRYAWEQDAVDVAELEQFYDSLQREVGDSFQRSPDVRSVRENGLVFFTPDWRVRYDEEVQGPADETHQARLAEEMAARLPESWEEIERSQELSFPDEFAKAMTE